MKLQVRLLERIWRRSQTDHDRLSCTKMRDRYCRSLAATKADFYSSEIESAANDNRSMFRIANQLLGRERQKQTFPHYCDGPTAVANHFAHHFADKIESIHRQLHNPPAAVTNAHPGNAALPLLSFQPASLEDVTTLIRNGKTKSSKIDPLPTALLKANTSVLAPIFVDLINLSYNDCTVPARLKHSLITPLLKPSGLPFDDYSSYRPIANLPYASKLLERHVAAQIRLHISNVTTSAIRFRAPTDRRTALIQRLCVYKMMYYGRLMLVSMLFSFYSISAQRLTRSTMKSFSRNYIESACKMTHIAGSSLTSPTEHSASLSMTISLA